MVSLAKLRNRLGQPSRGFAWRGSSLSQGWIAWHGQGFPAPAKLRFRWFATGNCEPESESLQPHILTFGEYLCVEQIRLVRFEDEVRKSGDAQNRMGRTAAAAKRARNRG